MPRLVGGELHLIFLFYKMKSIKYSLYYFRKNIAYTGKNLNQHYYLNISNLSTYENVFIRIGKGAFYCFKGYRKRKQRN